MDQIVKLIMLVIFIALVLIGYIAIMVAPGRYDEKMARPFRNRYFAHRGFHNIDEGIPENSLPAFAAACQMGYGIELDIQLTADYEVVVFHDPDLSRMCGTEGYVEDLLLEELQELRLLGTEERIPLFTEALETVSGRSPLIIEIKPGKTAPLLCKKAMEILASYEGDYCIESFDPSIVRWLKINAPTVFRGQLANRIGSYDKKYPFIARVFASRCLFNMAARPHFIAYESGKKPWPIKLTKALGAVHFVWTSLPEEKGGTPEADARENDVVIFEHYEPPIRIQRATEEASK